MTVEENHTYKKDKKIFIILISLLQIFAIPLITYLTFTAIIIKFTYYEVSFLVASIIFILLTIFLVWFQIKKVSYKKSIIINSIVSILVMFLFIKASPIDFDPYIYKTIFVSQLRVGVSINFGEIRTGMEKYYSYHKNYPSIPAIEGNKELQHKLRIDLGGEANFKYEVQPLSKNGVIGYKITGYLTEEGKKGDFKILSTADVNDRVICYSPKELNPDHKKEEWSTGVNYSELYR